jgi:hypothetical protein
MQIIIPAIYLLIVIAHAYIDYYKIKVKGKFIRHKTESIYYVIVCFALFWVMTWLTNVTMLPLVLFPLLTRAAFFDPLLNWFRGKGILYEGEAKKNRDKSFFDNLEKSIGCPVWAYRMIYFAAYLAYLIIYL